MTTLTEATELTDEQKIAASVPLTTLARCDGCGAQAYVRVVVISSQQELMFCRHHYQPIERDHRFLMIRDERGNLLLKPEPLPLPEM